ncbi:hypothetical protein [Neisseria sicca]|nr:hypothetical protein [Neisseria sicca]
MLRHNNRFQTTSAVMKVTRTRYEQTLAQADGQRNQNGKADFCRQH